MRQVKIRKNSNGSITAVMYNYIENQNSKGRYDNYKEMKIIDTLSIFEGDFGGTRLSLDEIQDIAIAINKSDTDYVAILSSQNNLLTIYNMGKFIVRTIKDPYNTSRMEVSADGTLQIKTEEPGNILRQIGIFDDRNPEVAIKIITILDDENNAVIKSLTYKLFEYNMLEQGEKK